MLTEEQKTKYLGSPYLCPFCGSDELTLGKTTADVNRAALNISCRQCKKRWTSIYELTRIEEDEWDMRKEGLKPKSPSEAE
jgi:transcription elongation factor Elf1